MVKVGKKIVKFRVPILILSIILLIPAVWGYVNTRINYDVLTYLPEDIETMQGQEIMTNDFGIGAFSMLMVDGMEDKEIVKLKEKVEKVDGVENVLWYDSLADISVPQSVLPSKLYDEYNTEDGTMMAVFFKDGTSSDETMKAITEIRKITGEQCFLSGMSAIVEDTKELAEKQAVAVRWAKLNKLIGSADGAKFKVIAQSYTLNLLLLHANKHLAYLSKRYKLQQVPDTLALQVIDCDMCDEIRTVYSLSGGESFLISLALALGLSSLSSNNLKVESLFIDEGFGSLDADSLRTAMEALEQLQMQGRKIGVISHVQEMSERISVQVQVHKKINGKSVLTVVG